LSLLFPKWWNALPTVAAIGGLLGVTGAVGGFWYYATPKFWRVGYMPQQPGGGFSHQIHAGKLGMDCRYCHTKIEKSYEANIPNVSTCNGCHAEGKLAKLGESPSHREKTEFIRQAFASDESIPWRRVHKVPDYVHNFPHHAHLAAGISCYSCHGRIDTMPVVHHAEPMSMSWCLDCHRDPTPNIVPPSMVTNLQWVEDTLKERAGGAALTPEAQAALDRIQRQPPENCGACHY
jgi:NAD-dependent SIR2 family protein deacetylase